MNTLPEWMRPASAPDISFPCEQGKRKRKMNPVRRGLAGFAGLIAEFLADDTVASSGLMQGLDARAKVIGIIGLIVVATFLHTFPALIICLGLCAVLAFASKVPVRRFMGVWLAAPILTSAIMLPAMLNIVSPGKSLFTIWHLSNNHFGFLTLPKILSVTDAGFLAAGRMILRTLACVSFAALLAATTRRIQLFRALRMLGVPPIFIMLLTMMERYLVVLIRAAEEIHLARLSRSVGTGRLGQEHKWVAAGIGSLFRRTNTLGHAVYRAMISRGYTGEAYMLYEPKWHRRDFVFLAALAIFSGLMLVIG